jgi:hypothetical protein
LPAVGEQHDGVRHLGRETALHSAGTPPRCCRRDRSHPGHAATSGCAAPDAPRRTRHSRLQCPDGHDLAVRRGAGLLEEKIHSPTWSRRRTA